MRVLDTPNILVTGCSSGIGLSAAITLHQRGYNVIASIRKSHDAAPLQKLGITTTILDLNSSDSIRKAVDFSLAHFNGKLDALFNNAAYGQPGAVEDLSRDVLRQQFETNLFGTHELTNLVITQMRKQNHGRVIYNSSVLGLVSMAYRGAYNASKFALEGLADTLRLELNNTNIHISLIEPADLSKFRENSFIKYKQHINKDNSAHNDIYLAMERRLTKQGAAVPFTLPPEAVVKKLIHALESKRPKIRYYVTFPTYLFATLKRLLPHRCLDWILLKMT